jgi:hypothetical protein
MSDFSMEFIRTQTGVQRDCDDWDAGLANFGYVACKGRPIPLTAPTLDEARAEAEQRWQERPAAYRDGKAEGYWIFTADGHVRTLRVMESVE